MASKSGVGDTLTVGRIGDNDALLLRLLEVLEVTAVEVNITGETCSTGIDAGGIDRLHIDVIAIDMVLELALARIVIIDLVEQILVEVGPFLKGKLLAKDARRDIAGDKGSLDGDGARTTHRINEVGIALPACHEDHASCQYLVERGCHALLSVATAVERLAATVEGQCGVKLGDVDVETDIGIGDGDIGTLPRLLAKLVHDGVFHFVGHKA